MNLGWNWLHCFQPFCLFQKVADFPPRRTSVETVPVSLPFPLLAFLNLIWLFLWAEYKICQQGTEASHTSAIYQKRKASWAWEQSLFLTWDPGHSQIINLSPELWPDTPWFTEEGIFVGILQTVNQDCEQDCEQGWKDRFILPIHGEVGYCNILVEQKSEVLSLA